MSYEYEQHDGKFTSFKIRQTPCKYGDAVFRQQRIEVGFYNEDGSFVRTIENLAIEAKEVTDVPSVVGMEVPAAILLNENDWGFGYFTLNERAITCFENSLANINCSLNRAVIINQLIIMMRQIEYPATRLPNVANQMMDEQNQNLISAVNVALLAAQSTYLPAESVPKFNKETASFFFKKTAKETQNESLQRFCIDLAISFVTDPEHLKMTASWIHEGKITIDGQSLNFELSANHKYEILKAYYASTHFTLDEKKALKEKALAGDDSDRAKSASKICDYSLPDPALKDQLWKEITDAHTTDTLAELRNKIAGFQQRKQQLDLMTPYFEKYYSLVSKIVETRDREFAEVFMSALSPAYMAREEDNAAFGDLLRTANEEKHEYFVLFLKKQIEAIDVIKRSRTLCETFKLD